MLDEIRSIRIESNNICYGPGPGADDEVEQYLTISSTGRVWFSARNYQQYCNSKDYCRKKQTSIDKWKAEFLLRLIDNISENMSFVTDVGSYDLEIRYSNDTKRRISGSLIGGVYSHAYGDENNVDVTRLIRRCVPVYGLWESDVSLLENDYPIYYCDELDLHIVGITHLGISWNMVYTNVEIPQFMLNE